MCGPEMRVIGSLTDPAAVRAILAIECLGISLLSACIEQQFEIKIAPQDFVLEYLATVNVIKKHPGPSPGLRMRRGLKRAEEIPKGCSDCSRRV
jgi:hypothetical protein